MFCRLTPFTSTRPLGGVSIPDNNRSKVVLPEPFGPRMPTTVVGWMVRAMSCNTGFAPYEYDRSTVLSNIDLPKNVGCPVR